MYAVDDVIVYGLHGVCRIKEIGTKNFAGNEQLYYTLVPVFDERSTFFLPVQGEVADTKLRPLLSEAEVDSLITAMPQRETLTINNDKHRKDIYRHILESGNRSEIMCLIKTLHQRQRSQLEAGKKQYTVDERFMKEAENVIYDEFAFVLNISRDEVLAYIKSKIEKEC